MAESRETAGRPFRVVIAGAGRIGIALALLARFALASPSLVLTLLWSALLLFSYGDTLGPPVIPPVAASQKLIYLAFAGIVIFVSETRRDALAKLDWFGFGMMSLFIASLQLFLDRGAQLDWFSSGEIMIEAIVCASAFYLLFVHTLTADKPFVNPRLFLDQNFAVSMVFIFVIGITYLASLALMTPYLQTLMGYPVITAGIVMGPRGVGTMVCMFIVGKLIGRVDTRLLLLAGLGLTAWAMYDMTAWTPEVSQWTIVSVGFIQGAGLGFLFVPLTTMAFSTLPPQMRGDGTGLYNLSRNIGSSVGISLVTALITENVQRNHESIAAYVTPFNHAFSNPAVMEHLNPLTATGRAALDGVITLQATIIAYMDDFKLLMLLSLGAMPLVLLLRKPRAAPVVDHSVAME